MSKKWFIGDAINKARKSKKLYVGGVDNKAHKGKKIYIGDTNGKARLCWSGTRGIIVLSEKGVSSDYVDKVWVSFNLGSCVSYSLPNCQKSFVCSTVACSENRFVLITSANSAGYNSGYWSDDGVNWNGYSGQFYPRDSYKYEIKYFKQIGKFVFFMNGDLFLSSDGINWTYKNLTSTAITDITCDDSGNILCTPYNGYQLLYNIETDTTIQISGESGRVALEKCCYGKGVYVGYERGKGFCTLDMTTKRWTLRSNVIATTTADAVDIVYGNGMFLAKCSLVAMAYSYDGINWTKYNINTDAMLKIGFDGEKFLGIYYSKYGYSYDGINWTFVDIGTTLATQGIAGN